MSRRAAVLLPSPYPVLLPRETVDYSNAPTVAAFSWTANRALYVPFFLPSTQRLASVSVFCTTVATGNFDLGLYAADGVTRLRSLGSTAITGTQTKNTWTLATPIVIEADRRYVLGMSASAGSVWIGTQSNAIALRVGGVTLQATAHPLPNPAVPAQMSGTNTPIFSLTFL